MSLSRRLKKIALRSEMISIDEQEYDDIDSKYSQQFNIDFEEEQKKAKDTYFKCKGRGRVFYARG